jgi:ABC-type glutathione transport system ATPase component
MTLLQIDDVSKTFRALGRRPVVALDCVAFGVEQGTITGLVGESGSGKTTLIRCLMGLHKPSSGSIRYDEIEVTAAKRAELRRLRREVQLVFQDPSSSLNPRMSVFELVAEGLVIHRLCASEAERRERVGELLHSVGLGTIDIERRPGSLSGGQRQRVAIARALAVGPRLLVCDEPVSSLDVSVQAQVLNLLQDMQEQLGLTILFVAHDLAVVRQVCSQVVVIKGGRIVEQGPADEVLTAPREMYTRALLRAVPIPDPARARRREREPAGA